MTIQRSASSEPSIAFTQAGDLSVGSPGKGSPYAIDR
jgi:hypothetical protein